MNRRRFGLQKYGSQEYISLINIRRVAKPVDLSVVCIAVWMKSMALHQLQQVSYVKEEQDWSVGRGPNPAALQIALLTISTGTPQSGRTVYVQ